MKSYFQIQNVMNYTQGIKNLIFFNDVHSYRQLVLTPWGYTEEERPGKEETDAVYQRVHTVCFIRDRL